MFYYKSLTCNNIMAIEVHKITRNIQWSLLGLSATLYETEVSRTLSVIVVVIIIKYLMIMMVVVVVVVVVII